MADPTITTQCCIAGGGPAGIMLGFLLARSGVNVVVLEKHPDFSYRVGFRAAMTCPTGDDPPLTTRVAARAVLAAPFRRVVRTGIVTGVAAEGKRPRHTGHRWGA